MPYKDPNKQREYHIKYRRYRRSEPKRTFTLNGGIWMCELCGATRDNGVQLDIHHKDQDNTNNEFDNLSCLCSECHQKLHAQWYKNIVPKIITGSIRSGQRDWRDGRVIG